MNKIKKINKWLDKNQAIIILTFIFISVLFLNILTPYIADDINYKNIWGTSDRVNNLWDVFVSQYWHYLTWGGRSVAHTIVQLFLIFPKLIFNIANSLCYIGIIYLINSIATNKKNNAWIILLIHLLLFLITPFFGEDFLWLTGSCNYAWTILIILLFINIYIKNKLNDSILVIIGMFLLGIISGWTNENTGCATVVIIASLLYVFKKINKEKLKKWHISGLIGSLLGFIILIAAPGNYARLSVIEENQSAIYRYSMNIIRITVSALEYLWPLLIALLIFYTYYLYKKKKPNLTSYIFILGGIVSTYAMIVSPTFPERAWLGIVVFFIVPTIILLDDLLKKEKLIKFILYDAVIILSAISFINYYNIAKELSDYNEVINERKEYIKNNPDQETYIFKSHKIDDRYSPIHGEDITPDPNNWVNQAQANNYEVTYIVGY